MGKKNKNLKFQGFKNEDSGIIQNYIDSQGRNNQKSQEPENYSSYLLKLFAKFYEIKNNAKTKPCLDLEVYEQKINEGRTAFFEYLDDELFNIIMIGCFHVFIEYNYKPGEKYYEAFYRYLRKALRNPNEINREWADFICDGDLIKLYKELVLPFVNYDKPFNAEFKN